MHLRFGPKEGSAIVESCLVMAVLCLILFGILQVSYLVAARNVINYSAVATARAAAVGMNDFMLHKVSHYAAIPAAGPIYTPQGFGRERPAGESTGAVWDNAISRKRNPRSQLGDYEVGVKEAYHLAGVTRFFNILDYENWQRDESTVHGDYIRDEDDLLTVRVRQRVPLAMPFSKLFFARNRTVKAHRNGEMDIYPAAQLEATVVIEDHSAFYLHTDERLLMEF